AKIKARRQSVIDVVKGDLDRLMLDHASAADQMKIDAHLTSIRAVEQRINAEVPACEAPAAPGGLDPQARADPAHPGAAPPARGPGPGSAPKLAPTAAAWSLAGTA